MNARAPLDAEGLPASERHHYDARAAALRARRTAAARVRRRRLLVIDLAVAATLAVFGLIVSPGLAVLALFALLVLGACGAWVLTERVRARRAARPRRRRRAGVWRGRRRP